MMVELEIKKGRLIRNEIIDSENANLPYTSFLLKDKKWVSVESLNPILRNFYAKIYGSDVSEDTLERFAKLLEELEKGVE